MSAHRPVRLAALRAAGRNLDADTEEALILSAVEAMTTPQRAQSAIQPRSAGGASAATAVQHAIAMAGGAAADPVKLDTPLEAVAKRLQPLLPLETGAAVGDDARAARPAGVPRSPRASSGSGGSGVGLMDASGVSVGSAAGSGSPLRPWPMVVEGDGATTTSTSAADGRPSSPLVASSSTKIPAAAAASTLASPPGMRRLTSDVVTQRTLPASTGLTAGRVPLDWPSLPPRPSTSRLAADAAAAAQGGGASHSPTAAQAAVGVPAPPTFRLFAAQHCANAKGIEDRLISRVFYDEACDDSGSVASRPPTTRGDDHDDEDDDDEVVIVDSPPKSTTVRGGAAASRGKAWWDASPAAPADSGAGAASARAAAGAGEDSGAMPRTVPAIAMADIAPLPLSRADGEDLVPADHLHRLRSLIVGCVDGHGGSGMAEHVRKRLPSLIDEHTRHANDHDEVIAGLKRAFLACDDEWLTPLESTAAAQRNTMDWRIKSRTGACAVVCLIRRTGPEDSAFVYTSNVGDCRAVAAAVPAAAPLHAARARRPSNSSNGSGSTSVSGHKRSRAVRDAGAGAAVVAGASDSAASADDDEAIPATAPAAVPALAAPSARRRTMLSPSSMTSASSGSASSASAGGDSSYSGSSSQGTTARMDPDDRALAVGGGQPGDHSLGDALPQWCNPYAKSAVSHARSVLARGHAAHGRDVAAASPAAARDASGSSSSSAAVPTSALDPAAWHVAAARSIVRTPARSMAVVAGPAAGRSVARARAPHAGAQPGTSAAAPSAAHGSGDLPVSSQAGSAVDSLSMTSYGGGSASSAAASTVSRLSSDCSHNSAVSASTAVSRGSAAAALVPHDALARRIDAASRHMTSIRLSRDHKANRLDEITRIYATSSDPRAVRLWAAADAMKPGQVPGAGLFHPSLWEQACEAVIREQRQASAGTGSLDVATAAGSSAAAGAAAPPGGGAADRNAINLAKLKDRLRVAFFKPGAASTAGAACAAGGASGAGDDDAASDERVITHPSFPLALRVSGALMVTRAFGNGFLKRKLLSYAPYISHLPYVSAEPEVTVTPLQGAADGSGHTLRFILMGSDGIFDLMTSKQATALAADALMHDAGGRVERADAGGAGHDTGASTASATAPATPRRSVRAAAMQQQHASLHPSLSADACFLGNVAERLIGYALDGCRRLAAKNRPAAVPSSAPASIARTASGATTDDGDGDDDDDDDESALVPMEAFVTAPMADRRNVHDDATAMVLLLPAVLPPRRCRTAERLAPASLTSAARSSAGAAQAVLSPPKQAHIRAPAASSAAAAGTVVDASSSNASSRLSIVALLNQAKAQKPAFAGPAVRGVDKHHKVFVGTSHAAVRGAGSGVVDSPDTSLSSVTSSDASTSAATDAAAAASVAAAKPSAGASALQLLRAQAGRSRSSAVASSAHDSSSDSSGEEAELSVLVSDDTDSSGGESSSGDEVSPPLSKRRAGSSSSSSKRAAKAKGGKRPPRGRGGSIAKARR